MWPPNGYGYKMMEAIWRVNLALPSFVSFDSVIIDSARNSPPKLGDRPIGLLITKISGPSELHVGRLARL